MGCHQRDQSELRAVFRRQRSVQVSGFDDFGHLTPMRRLLSASCSSGQRFAIRLPSDSQSLAKPLPSANSSPCRASRGLSPPSRYALPGAPKKKPRPEGRGFVTCLEFLQGGEFRLGLVISHVNEASHNTSQLTY